jgi:hypothetical protein
MAKTVNINARRQSLTNLGHAVIALVEDLQSRKAETGITYDDEYQLGVVLRKAIKAAAKAEIEGDQTDEQVGEDIDRGVKAANRQLAREVKKL